MNKKKTCRRKKYINENCITKKSTLTTWIFPPIYRFRKPFIGSELSLKNCEILAIIKKAKTKQKKHTI